MFIEANADITHEQFGHTLHHPFPMPMFQALGASFIARYYSFRSI